MKKNGISSIYLFYPTRNGKTSTLKIDYRSSGEGFWSAEEGSIGAWTSSVDKGWRSTETEMEKQRTIMKVTKSTIGHFRVAVNLIMKVRLSGELFIWKLVLFTI